MEVEQVEPVTLSGVSGAKDRFPEQSVPGPIPSSELPDTRIFSPSHMRLSAALGVSSHVVRFHALSLQSSSQLPSSSFVPLRWPSCLMCAGPHSGAGLGRARQLPNQGPAYPRHSNGYPHRFGHPTRACCLAAQLPTPLTPRAAPRFRRSPAPVPNRLTPLLVREKRGGRERSLAAQLRSP